MIAGGGATAFFGGALYVLSPVASSDLQGKLEGNAWLTFVMTWGVFVANTILAGLDCDNVRALRERLTWKFMGLVLVPSTMDCLMTCLYTIALSLIPSALVPLLKTTVQVLSIVVIQRLYLKQEQSLVAWGALAAVVVGVAIVVASDLVHSAAESGGLEQHLIGMGLVFVAGHMGAWRNIIEAHILKDGGLPGGALLMFESFNSAMVRPPPAAAPHIHMRIYAQVCSVRPCEGVNAAPPRRTHLRACVRA